MIQVIPLGDYIHPTGLLMRDAWGIFENGNLELVGSKEKMYEIANRSE